MPQTRTPVNRWQAADTKACNTRPFGPSDSSKVGIDDHKCLPSFQQCMRTGTRGMTPLHKETRGTLMGERILSFGPQVCSVEQTKQQTRRQTDEPTSQPPASQATNKQRQRLRLRQKQNQNKQASKEASKQTNNRNNTAPLRSIFFRSAAAHGQHGEKLQVLTVSRGRLRAFGLRASKGRRPKRFNHGHVLLWAPNGDSFLGLSLSVKPSNAAPKKSPLILRKAPRCLSA